MKSLYKDINRTTDYPSVEPLLNSSYEDISFLDPVVGLPRWLGICWWKGLVDFNPPIGYVTVSASQVQGFYNEMAVELAVRAFGGNYTAHQLLGSQRILDATASFLASLW